MSKRLQTSLQFETEEELNVFEELVKPLKANNQLRQTLISLLLIYQKHPAIIEGLHRGGEVTVHDPETLELQTKMLTTQTKLDVFNVYLANLGDTIGSLSPDNIEETLSNFQTFEQATQGTTQQATQTDEVEDLLAEHYTPQQQKANETENLKDFILETIQQEMAELKSLITTGVQTPAPQVVETAPEPVTVTTVPIQETQEEAKTDDEHLQSEEPQQEQAEPEQSLQNPFTKKREQAVYVLPEVNTEPQQEQQDEATFADIPSFLLDAASESMI